MYQQVWEKITQEASGHRAHDVMSGIARFHRIQVTPGIRAACEYAANTLEAEGFTAEIVEYPATGETNYWTWVAWQGWSIDRAEAWLIDPEGKRERLADFAAEPISVIQRSGSTPPEGLDGPVVAVDKAEKEETYEAIDVEGRWVLTDSNPDQVAELAVKKHGALGILYYGMRAFAPVREHPMDVSEARQYTAFRNVIKDNDVVGFVLSPRQGRQLVDRLKKNSKTEQAGKYRVWARVESDFYDSVTENVEVLIPGQTDEEVVVVAHICHPKPSANDNASGAGALVEAARILKKLIDEGSLETPRRGIRFILLPEMTGSYTFLSGINERASNLVAGLNLDMVGADQSLVGSTLQAEMPPAATPSFVAPLLDELLNEIRGSATNPSGTARLPELRVQRTRFSGGSDHIIFSDPAVGVPMPMLINWPDRYYHTSLDTPEKVSPDMLQKVVAMTATYAYWIANAGLAEAAWLGERLQSEAMSAVREVCDKAQRQLLDPESESNLEHLGRKLSFVLNRQLANMASVSRLVDTETEQEAVVRFMEKWQQEVLTVAHNAVERLRDYAVQFASAERLPDTWNLPEDLTQLDKLVDYEPSECQWEQKAADTVVQRLHPGPINTRGRLDELTSEEQEEFKALQESFSKRVGGFLGASHFGLLLAYYLDGQRSLLQAVRLVELDAGSADMEYAVQLIEWYSKLGLVEIKH